MDNWKLETYKQRLSDATNEEQIDIIAEMLDEDEVLTEGVMDVIFKYGASKLFKALRKRPSKLVRIISADTGVPVEEIIQMSQAERVDLKHKWMLGLLDDLGDAL